MHKVVKITHTAVRWYVVDVPDDWDDEKLLEAFTNEGVQHGDPHYKREDHSVLVTDLHPAPEALGDCEDSAIELGSEGKNA
jgi:hypothetical protein